jgi:hypothetical protein
VSTKRLDILGAITTRLQVIAIADGYETDAGAALYTGEPPQLGEDDPDAAIAVALGEDSPSKAGPGYLVEAPLLVHAVAKASLDDPWEAIELVLGDIKRAIELEDRHLAGLLVSDMRRGPATPFARDPGSLSVAVTLTYQLEWKEAWGNP